MAITVKQAVIVSRSDLQAGGKGADSGRTGFRGGGLGDDNGCAACREEPAKQDVAFVGRLTMGQVWHGVTRVRVAHKTEDHAFASLDPLAVGADGGRAGTLTGIDCVSLIGGYLIRIHAGNDQACGAATCLEHQKAVLPGGQTGEIKSQILAGGYPEVVGHVDHIIGVGCVRVQQRFLLHHPDLGPGCCLFKIGGENKSTARICQVVLGCGCRPFSASTAQHDIVGRVRIKKDSGAIEGIQAAPVRAAVGVGRVAQRLALGIGKGQVRVGTGDGDQVGTAVAGGAGIATQRRILDRCGAQQSEQTGLECEGQVAGIIGTIDGRDGDVVIVDIFDIGGGGGVLQTARFIDRDTAVQDDSHDALLADSGHRADRWGFIATDLNYGFVRQVAHRPILPGGLGVSAYQGGEAGELRQELFHLPTVSIAPYKYTRNGSNLDRTTSIQHRHEGQEPSLPQRQCRRARAHGAYRFCVA